MNKTIFYFLLIFSFPFNCFAQNETEPALHLAAANGDTAKIRSLCAQGVDINEKNIYGETALMTASRYGYLEIVKILVNNGANVNLTSNLGSPTLYYALTAKRYNIFIFLVLNGADLRQLQQHFSLFANKTSLRYNLQLYFEDAVYNGELAVVKKFLTANVDTRVDTTSGITPLLIASSMGHTEIARLLIENGADVNHKTVIKIENLVEGTTPLMIASAKGHSEMIWLPETF